MPGEAPTWPQVLSSLIERRDLDAGSAAWAMGQIMDGVATSAQLAAFLVLLRAKGETVEELAGIADQMLAHARPAPVVGDVLDIVGTGGDRFDTVNISTMACLVAAGAGAVVVKHGNRAASSRSGTADVIEALGVDLSLAPERAAEIAGEVGMTFLFARTFHPAMAHAGSVRAELRVPTVFNLLGPLANPARPRFSLVGCADRDAAPLMAGVLARRPVRAAVVRGHDGLDEVTVAGGTDVWWIEQGTVQHTVLSPQDVGLPSHTVAELRGADARHNAGVVHDLLAGAQGPVRDAVLLNAGLALALRSDDGGDIVDRWAEGVRQARGSLDSGSARDVLQRWVAATRG